MLTRKQYDLLHFIHNRLQKDGIPPSFDEMKEALDLASKSGIHRLITALEERGFIRRLAHRARALEVMKLPDQAASGAPRGHAGFKPGVIEGGRVEAANDTRELSLMGKIAAGTPIDAIEHETARYPVPEAMLGAGEHYLLEIEGDSMIEAGILNGDMVIIKSTENVNSGEIVVALVEGEQATLKRLRKKGASIALEPANRNYETKIYGADQVAVQGKLVGLIRRYH